MHKKVIGANIRAAREAKGFTQKELADSVGVTEGAVSHWETGKREIECENLFKVAETLDVQPPALLDKNYKPGAGIVPAGSPYAERIRKALAVLQSGTHFSASLENNIDSFYIGVMQEATNEEKMRDLAREEILRLIGRDGKEAADTGPFAPPGHQRPSLTRKKRRKAKE